MPEATPSIEGLQRQLLELKINIIEKQQTVQREEIDRHDVRLRPLEDTAIRFNFLLYLTMGGGLVGLFNLFAIGALIFLEGKP